MGELAANDGDVHEGVQIPGEWTRGRGSGGRILEGRGEGGVGKGRLKRRGWGRRGGVEERDVVGGSIGLHRKSGIGFSGFQRPGLRPKDGEEDLGKGKGSNFQCCWTF